MVSWRLAGAFLHGRSAGCTSTAIDDEHRPESVETPKNLWHWSFLKQKGENSSPKLETGDIEQQSWDQQQLWVVAPERGWLLPIFVAYSFMEIHEESDD